MGTTTHYSLRYPELTDTPDGPAQIGALASDADTALFGVAALLQLLAVKPSDQSVTSSTALVGDNDLKHAVAGNSKYSFQLRLLYNGDNAGELKLVLYGPAGSSVASGMHVVTDGSSTSAIVTTTRIGTLPSSAVTIGCLGASFSVSGMWDGVLTTGSSAGTFGLQWAQGTSNGTATKILAGSSLTLTKVT